MTTSTAMYKFLKTLRPGGIQTRDLLFCRLPHLINIEKSFISKQPSPSAGTRTTYFQLALFYKENRPFLLIHFPSS
jgi:hypothetical protein